MNEASSELVPPPSDFHRFLRVGEPGRVWRRRRRRRFEDIPRRHAELVALLGVTGWMRYFLDGSLVTLGPRSLLVAHPGQAHFLVDESAEFDMIVAVIAPEVAAA